MQLTKARQENEGLKKLQRATRSLTTCLDCVEQRYTNVIKAKRSVSEPQFEQRLKAAKPPETPWPNPYGQVGDSPIRAPYGGPFQSRIHLEYRKLQLEFTKLRISYASSHLALQSSILDLESSVAEVRTALADHMSMLETQESEAQHVTAQRIISHCGLNCATSILGQMRPWLTFNPLPAECLKDFLDAYVYRQNMPRMELEQLAFIGGPRGISELTEAYEQSLAARTQLAWSIQELQLKQQAVEKAAPRADTTDPALIDQRDLALIDCEISHLAAVRQRSICNDAYHRLKAAVESSTGKLRQSLIEKEPCLRPILNDCLAALNLLAILSAEHSDYTPLLNRSYNREAERKMAEISRALDSGDSLSTERFSRPPAKLKAPFWRQDKPLYWLYSRQAYGYSQAEDEQVHRLLRKCAAKLEQEFDGFNVVMISFFDFDNPNERYSVPVRERVADHLRGEGRDVEVGQWYLHVSCGSVSPLFEKHQEARTERFLEKCHKALTRHYNGTNTVHVATSEVGNPNEQYTSAVVEKAAEKLRQAGRTVNVTSTQVEITGGDVTPEHDEFHKEQVRTFLSRCREALLKGPDSQPKFAGFQPCAGSCQEQTTVSLNEGKERYSDEAVSEVRAVLAAEGYVFGFSTGAMHIRTTDNL